MSTCLKSSEYCNFYFVLLDSLSFIVAFSIDRNHTIDDQKLWIDYLWILQAQTDLSAQHGGKYGIVKHGEQKFLLYECCYFVFRASLKGTCPLLPAAK